MSNLSIYRCGNLYKMIVNPLIEEIETLEFNYDEVMERVTRPKIAALLLEEIISNGDPQSITERIAYIVNNNVPFNMALELTINIPFTRVINEIEKIMGAEDYQRFVRALNTELGSVIKLTRSRLIIDM